MSSYLRISLYCVTCIIKIHALKDGIFTVSGDTVETGSLHLTEVIRCVPGAVILLEEGDTEKKIVALIRENSHITQRKLSDMIGLTRQYVGRCMDSLQARQIIRRIGPDKGGEWMIVNDNVR